MRSRLKNPWPELVHPRERRRFERYCRVHIQGQLLPLFADISLLLTLMATLVFILAAGLSQGWSQVHPITYLYLTLMVLLLLLHRLRWVRRRAPLMATVLFLLVSGFAMLGFLSSRGEPDALTGLFFFLSSLGFLTLSPLNTLVLLSLNALFLMLSLHALPAVTDPLAGLLGLLSDWFVVSCHLIALASAVFNRWLFRRLLALQYLLGKRNRELQRTWRSLQETESLLVQGQKQEALSLMAKGLLHEIINPLNNASQALQYARSLKPDAGMAEVLGDVDEQHQRIDRILKQLVEFSRPPSAEQFQQVDLLEAVENALHWCRSELKGVEVRLQSLENLKGRAHPQALQQILINLILNARNALMLTEERRPPSLLIEGRDARKHSVLVIEDNGVGMPPEQLGRIREAFISFSEQPGRLGLGLSICEALLRHHGGRMDIESIPDQGTRVSLYLPNQFTSGPSTNGPSTNRSTKNGK